MIVFGVVVVGIVVGVVNNNFVDVLGNGGIDLG